MRYFVQIPARDHGSVLLTPHGEVKIDHENGTPLSDAQRTHLEEQYGATIEEHVPETEEAQDTSGSRRRRKKKTDGADGSDGGAT